MSASSTFVPASSYGNRISPLYNDVFLKVFGGSPVAARALSNAILRRVGLPELGEVERIEADAVLPSSVGLKAPHCDVVIVGDRQIVDLEAQRSRVDVDNKALFYASKLLCANTPKDSDREYRKLPQVVVIVLLEGYTKFGGDQYLTYGHLVWERDDAPVAGTDRMAFVTVELDKVARVYNGVTDEVMADELSAWLYVLARGWREKEEVDEIMGSFPPIEEWATQYGLAIDDPDIKKKYEAYQDGIMEWNSIVSEAKITAREEGRAEGRAKGRAEGRAEEREALTRKLRELGVDEETLARAIAETATS